ncbi:MAG: lytic transglycosylase domain-containing protein [Halothiobacillaceae bacterium]
MLKRYRRAVCGVALLVLSATVNTATASSYALLPNGGYVAFDPTKPLFIITTDAKGKPVRYVLRPGFRVLERDETFAGAASQAEWLKDTQPRDQLHHNTPYDGIIHAAAAQHGIPPGLVKAVIHVESGFNPKATSRAGAMGMMQLMPKTARRFGVSNAYDPVQNIMGGVRYLRDLLAMFNGNVALALAGYNAGEHRVIQYGGIPPFEETQRYVRRVMMLAQQYIRSTPS